jgi:uncharacterized protein
MSAPVPGQVEAAIGRWIDEVVVGLRLCPFAAGPWKAGEVRIAVSAATSPEDAVKHALDEALHLMEVSEDEVGTTLVAFPSALSDFEDLLDAEATLAHILDQAGGAGILQVASFHPDYLFEGEDPDALSHWTNRAPVPILHLLRESQVSQAVDQHPDPDAIPADNVRRLDALGRDALVRLWRSFQLDRAL